MDVAIHEDTAPDVPAVPPPSLATRLAYGFGATAYGVKSNAFDFFVLIFYSQVIGLDAFLVGVAIFIALLVDALSDPVVGYWSDNLRTKWGRRHPFMYAAAVPVTLSYYFLWTPPDGASQMVLFFYLLVFATLIRTAITFYETPSTALIPDLTQDYDERTSLFSFRYFFGWVGGNAMSVMMYFVVFPLFVTDLISDGRFNRDAYEVLGLVGSTLIFIAILISALGTHARITHLRQPPAERKMSLGIAFREIFETLSDRSFVSLFVAALLGAIATGLAAGLTFYFLIYFWEFTDIQTGMVLLGTFVAAGIGFTLSRIVSRSIGKKRGAMIVGLIAFLGAPLPIVLRLIDVLPPNESQFVFWFVLIANIIDVGLIICFQILFASMIADLVEQSELKTGRRSEGVFTSAVTFIRKSVQGLGLLTASLVLGLAGVKAGADVSEVSDQAVWKMGAYYVPIILTLWMSMIAVVSTYKIDRSTHEENLKKLRQAV